MPTLPFATPRISRLLVSLIVLLLGSGGRAAETFPGESAKWRRYQSPHFEMFSAVKDAESRDLLHKLEMLRSLFYDTMKLKETQPKDVTIYYFNNEKAFKAYSRAKQKEIAGFYLDRPDRAVIVLSPAWDDEDARTVIFHEYIHHLNRAIGTNPPVWYNEGVAELFSTIEFEKKQITLGNPLEWHLASLRSKKMMPLEVLFAVDHKSPIYNTGEHSGQFYAQSWILMHYWQFGMHKLDRSKIDLFLKYVATDPQQRGPGFLRQLFQETMGMDYADMERAVENYFSSGSFFNRKAPLPQVSDPATYESQALSPTESVERLAELALRVNESPVAKLTLLDVANTSPTAARVWEILGTDAWVQGEDQLAKERWEKALAAGSTNPAIFHELGLIVGERWFGKFNYYLRLPPETAAQFRALFKRSIESAPDQVIAYELLAWVEASVEAPDITNVNLVQSRYKTLRHKARTVVAFAMVRVRLGDPDGARKILSGLAKLPPDHWSAVAAETILARLENREPRPIPPPAGEGDSSRFRFRSTDFPRL